MTLPSSVVACLLVVATTEWYKSKLISTWHDAFISRNTRSLWYEAKGKKGNAQIRVAGSPTRLCWACTVGTDWSCTWLTGLVGVCFLTKCISCYLKLCPIYSASTHTQSQGSGPWHIYQYTWPNIPIPIPYLYHSISRYKKAKIYSIHFGIWIYHSSGWALYRWLVCMLDMWFAMRKRGFPREWVSSLAKIELSWYGCLR